MKASREILEDQQQRYETQLSSLNSFVKELSDMTAKYGTERAQYEEDLLEAKHNIKYYEGEIARVKDELRECGAEAPAKGATDNLLPQTMKQGLGSLIVSTISFAAGALLGSKMKSRGRSQGAPQENKKGD
jgi:chromosome segregation ATPase